MAKERKIRCDCGGVLSARAVQLDGVESEAMVCPKCGFTTFTKNQAMNFLRLKRLHSILDSERKVIKVGNSMGLTLPDQLRDFGVKVGRKVRTVAIDSKSFKVELS